MTTSSAWQAKPRPTSENREYLDIETRDIIQSKQGITKALIRLRGCTG